jgi:hypothetical protein
MEYSDTRNEQDGVAATERLFEELRDHLLSLSQKFAKSEQREWETAERFFLLSKKVDQLREQMSLGITNEKLNSGIAMAKSLEEEPPPSLPVTRRKSKRDYPKYSISSDVLIKTGLSRDRRTEYEHAVPKREFDAVAQTVADLRNRKSFRAEEVLKKVGCPSYQVYLVLSVLKERGLLTVPRRGLYTVLHPNDFAAESQSVWDSLAAA